MCSMWRQDGCIRAPIDAKGRIQKPITDDRLVGCAGFPVIQAAQLTDKPHPQLPAYGSPAHAQCSVNSTA